MRSVNQYLLQYMSYGVLIPLNIYDSEKEALKAAYQYQKVSANKVHIQKI